MASVILVSEIGDKTFFIAAIMAMRNDRAIVFSGAIAALVRVHPARYLVTRSPGSLLFHQSNTAAYLLTVSCFSVATACHAPAYR